MDQQRSPSSKLSRQQLRAQAREKRDADGWIAVLGARDPGLVASIRTAIGNRHVTRAELEEAIGMSLADTSPNLDSTALEHQSEPERIAVQHILISFAGAGTSATRTQEEAATLASEMLQRARQGEDFGELVRTLTDDSLPGIYRLCNTGFAPRSADEYRRGGMVPPSVTSDSRSKSATWPWLASIRGPAPTSGISSSASNRAAPRTHHKAMWAVQASPPRQ